MNETQLYIKNTILEIQDQLRYNELLMKERFPYLYSISSSVDDKDVINEIK